MVCQRESMRLWPLALRCIKFHVTLSLRARLLMWLLVPLAPFVAVTSLTSADTARRTADLMQDAALLSSARTIIEDVAWVDGQPAVTIQPAALEIFESPFRDQVFYKVVTARGRLLVGTPGLETPSQDTTRPVFFDTGYEGRQLRAVAYSRLLYDDGKPEQVTVVVGKTQASRQAMIDQLWRPQLLCELLMLVLVGALVPLGLAVELYPLMRLKDHVDGRQPMQLEAMPVSGLPREMRPIVDAINQCIGQLKLYGERQRQFVADAAHQLCTPLALLDTQIQYACRIAKPDADETARDALQHALQGAVRSTARMKAMTKQLLLLARAESTPSYIATQADLAAVVRAVLEELIVAAARRGIDLGAQCGGEALVAGDAALLAALVSNLIDNAIRYTQPGGHVTATVTRAHDWVRLEVIDDGPGIAADLLPHVFERFVRGSTSADGSGLGLPIVKEIARHHGGAVELGSGPDGAGLVVTVTLPAWNGKEHPR
jgi:two-component system, OmpR family, sensor histidine kinase TctE